MNKVISLGPAMPQTNKEKRKEEKIEARSPFLIFFPFGSISSLTFPYTLNITVKIN